MDFNPVKVANANTPDFKQGTTLFREMYNDIFSDNRNVVIFVLLLLLLMAFSRINFINSLGGALYDILLNLYKFFEDLIYSLIYSVGEILNASSETVSTVSKTTIDLGNGAVQDVGNLLTDMNCQYKGNPVKPNQCQLPQSKPQVVYVAAAPPEPPQSEPPQSEPEIIQPQPPQPPTKRKLYRPTPNPTKGKVRPEFMMTAPPSVISAALTGEEGFTEGTVESMNPNTVPNIPNPLPPQYSQPPEYQSMAPEIPTLESGASLDKVLESMSNRRSAAFVPDPVDSATNSSSKMKSSWCLIGEMNNKKSCVEIDPSIQACQSGTLYKSQAQCSA